jgi:Fe-Mn family superoxide dismutase
MEANTPIAAGAHVLPPLPYPTNALEPAIDAETLMIHHDRHHKKYVEDLNAAELSLESARRQGDFKFVRYWEDAIAFNGSGHILHSVYWRIMAPPGTGGEPGQYTSRYIDWYFGGMEQFKAQFIAAANAVQGSGWSILGYNPAFFRLELLQCEKHQNLTQWGIMPILVCDVWEHSYYLKYQNDRASYIDAWWGIINWTEVEARFVKAAQGVVELGA